MSELTIVGKKVVLKDSFTMEYFSDIFKLLTDANQMDLRSQVPLATRVIESWEFDGDPSDSASYEKLDVLKVVIPLFRKIMRHVNELMSGTEEGEDESKN